LMVKKKALQEIPDKCKYYNIEKHPKWGGKAGLLWEGDEFVDLARKKVHPAAPPQDPHPYDSHRLLAI